MPKASPIYSIAKELNIDSSKIILACKTLGINAKGATKRLNNQELEKVKSYFETGKNVSQEVVDLNESNSEGNFKLEKIKERAKVNYFENRLIRKS